MAHIAPQDLLLALTDLAARLGRTIDQALSVHGISYTEYTVLLQLSRVPDQRMRRIDLAQSIGITASGVTRLLNPMEKTGLVSKQVNARDARVSLVALSPAGQRLFDDARRSVLDASSRLFEPLKAADRLELARLIQSLSVTGR